MIAEQDDAVSVTKAVNDAILRKLGEPLGKAPTDAAREGKRFWCEAEAALHHERFRQAIAAAESALALATGERLRVLDLGLGAGMAGAELAARPGAEVPLSLEAYERCAIERALREAGGDATQAARRLGIGRSTFYRKLSKHGIVPRRRPAGGGVGAQDAIR